MEGIPIIKLEAVKDMKTAILYALSKRIEDIKRTVEEELNNLDIEGIVRHAVQYTTPSLIKKVIEDTIKSQIEWQFHQAIKEPIANAIKQAVENLFIHKE